MYNTKLEISSKDGAHSRGQKMPMGISILDKVTNS